jgi:hypothetical protein
VGSRTETLWIHANDYDLYLKCKQEMTGGLEENIGVFLDEYMPFHPDYLYLGIDAPYTPDEYYPPLRSFFDLVEKAYDVRIVIAAHPRSKYEDHPDYFGGREVLRGKTIELIQRSRFVLLHCSTAVNFAVLFKKPCIFVTTNLMQERFHGPSIRKMAALLGKTPIVVDNGYVGEIEKELNVDESAYRSYRNAYIKRDGTDEKPFWQIFSDRIKGL